MAAKRRFGRVRKLPSGRWQARYKGPDGIDRPARRTFQTKHDAEVWLTRTEAEIINDQWIDPALGRVAFADYARSWVEERPGLRPKTLQLYKGLIRLHMIPMLGTTAVSDITEPQVRRWRRQLLSGGLGPVTVAKAYRLLKAIMETAVDDGLIRRNPCRLKGAGQERSPERPLLTIRQIFALADAIEERYRVLVLLAAFGSMRWGELAALTRRQVDLQARTITIDVAVVELIDGSRITGPPKSEAGKRIVTIPGLIASELATHLERYAQSGDDGLVFVGPKGAPLRRPNFSRVWRKAITYTGLAGVHFHDLRHAGNTFAAVSGATLRELMGRMGHSTTRAALIYQHQAKGRDQIIADALGKLAEAELGLTDNTSGT